jgi:hypothetical protein
MANLCGKCKLNCNWCTVTVCNSTCLCLKIVNEQFIYKQVKGKKLFDRSNSSKHDDVTYYCYKVSRLIL